MRDDAPGTERCPRCDHIECRCGYSDEPDYCEHCGDELGPKEFDLCADCARAEKEEIRAEARAERRGDPEGRPEPESEAEYVMRRGG